MKSLVESLSEKLLGELLKAGRVTRRPNMNPWYVTMAKILKKPNGRMVVEWVIANLRETYCPRVFSPSSLLAKFDRLEKCWKKNRQDEVHPRTEAVFEALQHLNWPVKESELKASINRSLMHLKEARGRLRLLDEGAAEYFVDQMTPIDSFCLSWYLRLWKRLSSWNDFSGDLSAFEFDTTNNTTKNFIQQTLTRFPSDQVESCFDED